MSVARYARSAGSCSDDISGAEPPRAAEEWRWPISPQLAAAKQLLDAAKQAGFTFQRIAPGEDAPLRGVRHTPTPYPQLA